MKGSYLRGRRLLGEYGWNEAACDLAQGVSPDVVAVRLGEPVDYVLEVAEAQGWPVIWDNQPTQSKWVH